MMLLKKEMKVLVMHYVCKLTLIYTPWILNNMFGATLELCWKSIWLLI